jgi:hypothetical protein
MNELKKKYEQKKLNESILRLKKADFILNENNPSYHAKLLLEEINEKELEQATEVIEKLRKISKSPGAENLKVLKAGIDLAIKDINEYTGGGIKDRARGALASLFSKTNPSKNPILKGLGFSSALESGFSVLPQVLKNNIEDIETDENKQKPIIDLIKDDQKIQKAVVDSLKKAFVPKGAWNKVFSKIPFVVDNESLIIELLDATPEQLGSIAGILKSGTKAEEAQEIVQDAEETSKNAGTEETEQNPEQEKKRKTILIRTAKESGIKKEETIKRFLIKILGWKDGANNPNASIAIEALSSLATAEKIPENQLDGFVDGIAINKEAFKNEIEEKIKELEAKKEASRKKPENPKSKA